MSHTSKPSITLLLEAVGRGDQDARDRLWSVMNKELRAMAANLLRGERADHTLQPTALVNEAWMKWVDQKNVNYRDRVHFVSICAQLMRRILSDHAKGRGAQKRGGGWGRFTLDGALLQFKKRDIDVLALNEALDKLEAMDGRQATVVELRYFGGLTIDETAALLDVSHTTVEVDWKMAKWFLAQELRDEDEANDG